MDLIHKVMGKVEEFGKVWERGAKQPLGAQDCRWEPPPLGAVKVNSDATMFPAEC